MIWYLEGKQDVCKMVIKNVDARAQVEKGWHFQDTDSPTPSWWDLELFDHPLCVCVCECLYLSIYIYDLYIWYVCKNLHINLDWLVRSQDEDIVAGVLQGDTLAPYLLIICVDYILRTSIDKIKENGFKLTKERSRRYPAKTITDADYADDIALLANAPTQAETCYIVWNEPLQASASLSMHTRRNICALIKQATSPH